MTSPKINLIKPGYYPVRSLSPLSYKNTQAYFDLKHRAGPLYKGRLDRYQELKAEVLGTWTTTGIPAPKWANRPVGEWSAENMIEFIRQTNQYYQDHGQNGVSGMEERLKMALERDFNRAQGTALMRLCQVLLDNPEQMVAMQESSFQFLNECESGEILTEPDHRPAGDWRGLSKAMFEHADHAMNQTVLLRKLVRIDLEREINIGLSTPNKAAKKSAEKKKAKDDGSGPVM